MFGEFVDGEPFATAGIWVDEGRFSRSGIVNVVKEGAVDEVAGFDPLAVVLSREVLWVF